MYPTFRSSWQRAANPCTRGPAPSKIPYGGFSPVPLQTSIPVQPSPAHRALICTVPPPQVSTRFICPVIWTFAPSERAEHRQQIRSSSGPWLRNRFYCPAASSLTMATSEPLQSRDGLFNSSTALRRLAPQTAEVPQFTLPVLWHVPSSVPRRSQRSHMTIDQPPVLPSSLV